MVNIMHGRNLMKIENMISSRGYRRIHQGRGVWCVQARGLRARIRVIFSFSPEKRLLEQHQEIGS